MGRLRDSWNNAKKDFQKAATKEGDGSAAKRLMSQFKDGLGPTLDKIDKAVQDKKVDAATQKLITSALNTTGKYYSLFHTALIDNGIIGGAACLVLDFQTLETELKKLQKLQKSA